MTRLLLPRMGKGRKVLGGVVFTDGVAEATLRPSIRRFFEIWGVAVIDDADQLDEHTVDELREIADRGQIHLPSHMHKADMIRVLLGGSPVDHEDEAKGAAIVDVDPPADIEPSPQEPSADTPAAPEPAGDVNAPETGAPDLSDTTTPEEDDAWQPSPPSTTTPPTGGSRSPQARRRSRSADS